MSFFGDELGFPQEEIRNFGGGPKIERSIHRKRAITAGSETSQYREERKSTETRRVVVSESRHWLQYSYMCVF